MSLLLGEYIAKYRKEQGITQEELGKAAGVSTQAVSRWECGGAPDVLLLPAIADRLGVSIDALFGRGSQTPVKMENMVRDYIRSVPQSQQLEALSRLNWEARKAMTDLESVMELGFVDECAPAMPGNAPRIWLRTVCNTDYGLMLGMPADDFNFFAVFPEPETGYAGFLASDEDYAKWFSILGKPFRMQVMQYLYSCKAKYFVAATIVSQLALDLPVVEETLADLASINLLESSKVALGNGDTSMYIVHDNCAWIPFLILTKWLTMQGDIGHLVWMSRTNPYLKREDTK